MGILYSNAEILIRAKKNGVSFDSILTIGHLKNFLTKNQILQLIKKYQINIDLLLIEDNLYSDLFFKQILGAKEVQSLDYSDYESCDIVHDMNNAIDYKYHEKFDVVIDGGSLEHIFNFPVAIENCMNLLRKSGSLFMFTMANNHLGHGFYQFSPELFFRIFNDDNGFKVVDILLEEHKFPGPELTQKTKIYEVEDPLVLKERVGLVTKSPVLMLVHAIRKEIKPIFSTYPIQSDYALVYDQKTSKREPSVVKSLMRSIFHKLPLSIKHYLEGRLQLSKYSFKNSSFYKRTFHK